MPIHRVRNVTRDLLRLCLFSRGYRQVDMQELTGIQSYVPLPPGEDPK